MDNQINELGVISFNELARKIRKDEVDWLKKNSFILEDMTKKCIFPKDVADRFITALTSGCYEQTRMQFAFVDETGKEYYCIIGILLKVLGASTLSLHKEGNSSKEESLIRESLRNKIASISKLNEDGIWWKFSNSIRYMNDYSVSGFQEIAEWIKRNIETI